MTTNPSTPTASLPSSTLVQTQVAELRELEKQFPGPTWDEVRPDWEWLYAECNAGKLFDLYGQFVAVCEKQVLGTDSDPLGLRIRMTEEHQRHPERFVITFLGDWRDYT